MFASRAVSNGAGGVDIGDNISNSLMLDSSASQYLSRTVTTSATATYTCLFKRGKLGVICPLFDSSIKFNANDTLTAFGLTTTAVFRDPTAWLFIHVSNGGLYVNGISYGAVTTSALTNPRIGFDGTNYADGYMAMCYIVDGTSDPYTNYGRISADTTQWVNKNAAPTYGAKGSLLTFSNSSALGTDSSGNGNNWTLNGGITSSNQYTDTPTNNYCVFSPIAPLMGGAGGGSAMAVLAKGNLNASNTGTAWWDTRSTMPFPSTGKWYFEITVNNVGTDHYLGIGGGNTTSPWSSYQYNGSKVLNGVTTAYGATYATGDVIGFEVDMDAGTLTCFKNNTTQGVMVSDLISAYPSGGWFIRNEIRGAGCNHTLNCGQKTFTYTNHTTFKALCTANLVSETVTVSGTFTGNAAADGPFVFCNGYPTTLTINSNAVTFATHADRTAAGFKLRTSSASYNASGSNTWTATIVSNRKNCLKYATAQGNP